MFARLAVFGPVLFVLVAGGCGLPGREQAVPPACCTPEGQDVPLHTVWLVGHGWHTGIVFHRAELDLPLSNREEYSGCQYLEVGWGDADYYMAKEVTACLVIDTTLLPSPGVMHVVGFQEHPLQFDPGRTVWGVVELQLTEGQFQNLQEFVRQSFILSGPTGLAEPLAPGLYGVSSFYDARGYYTICHNCNNWTAHALEAAGLNVCPTLSQCPEAVVARAGQYGHVWRNDCRAVGAGAGK